MNLIADTHTHTTASTHAYSTLGEMVHAAARQGLYAIAITDHGVAMPGAPGRWYFKNLTAVPHLWENVLVLRGQECNVLDFDGSLDLQQEDIPSLDWVVASIHNNLLPPEKATPERVTNLWLKVAENPHVQVIGHCGSPRFRFDYERVIPAFGRQGKLIELNEASFRIRKNFIPQCMEIMRLCKKHGTKIVVNTDSHFAGRVGRFDSALRALEELDFPEELVVNSSRERFRAYLREYTRVLDDPFLQAEGIL